MNVRQSLGPNIVQIDGQKLAEQLGLSISSIPPKFTNIRKRYNLNIKVSNTGTIRRSRRSTAIVARPTNIDPKEGDDMDPPSQSAA